MKQTTNLKLNKPDAGDPVSIADLNANMDVLDTALVVSAEDYVENAHVWFRNELWANKISCSTLSVSNTLSISGNFTAAWLQSTSVSDLGSAPPLYPVFRSDKWIYSRTSEEMRRDLKAHITVSANEPSGGVDGDIWIQV